MLKTPSNVDYSAPNTDTDNILLMDGVLTPGPKFSLPDATLSKATLRTTGNNINYLTGYVTADEEISAGEVIATLPSRREILSPGDYHATSLETNRWVVRDVTSGAAGGFLRDIAYNPDAADGEVKFVIVGALGQLVLISTDGIVWEKTTDIGDSINRSGVMWSSELDEWTAVGNSGTTYSSLDGIAWVLTHSGGINLNTITRGVGVYISAGVNGGLINSLDGTIWDSTNSQLTETIHEVGFVNGSFIGVANAGKVTTSATAAFWVESDPTPTTEDIYTVVSDSDGTSYAFADNTTAIATTDGGKVWAFWPLTGITNLPYNFRTSSVIGEEIAVMGATEGKILSTVADVPGSLFQRFTTETPVTSEDLLGSTNDGENFYLVGANDTLVVSQLNPDAKDVIVQISGNQIIALTNLDTGTNINLDRITFVGKYTE